MFNGHHLKKKHCTEALVKLNSFSLTLRWDDLALIPFGLSNVLTSVSRNCSRRRHSEEDILHLGQAMPLG